MQDVLLAVPASSCSARVSVAAALPSGYCASCGPCEARLALSATAAAAGSSAAAGATASSSSSGGAAFSAGGGSPAAVVEATLQGAPDPQVTDGSRAALAMFDLTATVQGVHDLSVTLGLLTMSQAVFVDAAPPAVSGKVYLTPSSLGRPLEPAAAGKPELDLVNGGLAAVLELRFTEPVKFDPRVGLKMEGAVAIRFRTSSANTSWTVLVLGQADLPMRFRVARDAYSDACGKTGEADLELQLDPLVGGACAWPGDA